MRRTIILLSFLLIAGISRAQNKTYITTGGDWGMLAFSSVKQAGENISTIVRYTAFWNVGINFNYTLTKNLVVFSGTNVRNIGLIIDEDIFNYAAEPNEKIKTKHREYTFGIPLGFKFGDFKERFFLFGGVEVSFPFHHKEKVFVDGVKSKKFSDWFSDKSPDYYNSVFVGFSVYNGMAFKFHYYLSDFFNENYKRDDVKPYENITTDLFFVTLSYEFSSNRKINYPPITYTMKY